MTPEERRAITMHLQHAIRDLNLVNDPERARQHIVAALEALDWPDLPRLRVGSLEANDCKIS